MPEAFDPYYEWLGIQPKDQPPNHYRLLGVELFEPNSNAIANAADRQMAHLKACSAGPQALLSQKLLNEVSAARVCLLNPQARIKYDEQLKAKLTPPPIAPAVAMPASAAPDPAAMRQLRTRTAAPIPTAASLPTGTPLPTAEPLIAPEPYRKRAQPKAKATPPLVLGAIGVAALALVGIAVFLLTRGDKPVVANASANPAQSAPTAAKPAVTPSPTQPTTPREQPRPKAKVTASSLPMERPNEPLPEKPMEPSDEPKPMDSATANSADEELTDDSAAAADDRSITADRIVLWNAHDAELGQVGARRCNVLLLRNDQLVWQKRDVKLPSVSDREEKASLDLPRERFDTVRLELISLDKEWPALSEVEVFSKGKNIARGARVRASSAHRTLQDDCENLVDGAKWTQKSAAGYWMPATGRPGCTEIDMRPQNAGILADRLVVWNQHNGHHNDRGSLQCKVLLFLGPREVWRRDGLAIPWSGNRDEKLDLPLPRVECNRVRVEVTKFQGGSGLAEVEVYRQGRNVARGAAVVASSTLNDDVRFRPANVTDGITSSAEYMRGYWLSAGEGPSWVDVELTAFRPPAPAKPVNPRTDRIVIWNQRNGSAHDRGADLCDVVLLDGQREVWRCDHVRIPWSPDEDTFAAIPLPKVRFSRVRVEQNWWLGGSGGLAEIEVFHKGKNVARQARVTASAYFGPSFEPELVRDGITSSATDRVGFWLLPNNTPGWIELDVGPIDTHVAASTSTPTANPHGEATTAVDQPARRAPPTPTELDQARKLLRAAFAEALAKAKKPEERLKLAGEFVARAREMQESPHDQYVLLDEARKLAAEAGNYTLAGEAVEELAAAFEVNADALRAEALLESAKKAKSPTEFQAATQAALDLLDEAEEAADWERADQLAKMAVSFSTKARDLPLTKSVKQRSQELETHKKLGAEIAGARTALEKDPNDAAANLTLGRHLCLARNDWKAGLPLLAKSGDPKLKVLADAELGVLTNAVEMVKRADAWWEYAVTQNDESRTPFLTHAADWYERAAAAGLSGIHAAKAAKRIEEASSLGGRANQEQWISYAATCTATSAHAGWAPIAALLTGRGLLYYTDDFAFHTEQEAGAHITIDLGAEKTVRRLEIENRRLGTDGQLSLAKDMGIWLSSGAGERGQQVWRATDTQRLWNVTLPKPIRARYVTIGYPPDHTAYFHLASVKVFGSESAPLRGPGGTGRVRAIHRSLGYPLREHPSDAVAFHGHWYKWFNNSVDPSEAQRQCFAMGGYLVCLETEEEYQVIRKMPQKIGFWFGLCKDPNGKWSWINGAPLTIDHWGPGEPTGDGPSVVFGNDKWNDWNGATVFVCEWEY